MWRNDQYKVKGITFFNSSVYKFHDHFLLSRFVKKMRKRAFSFFESAYFGGKSIDKYNEINMTAQHGQHVNLLLRYCSPSEFVSFNFSWISGAWRGEGGLFGILKQI